MAIERRGIQFTLSAENRARGAFSEVQRQMADVSAASAALRNTLAGLGVGLSLGGLVSFIKSGVDAAAQLDDLSEITGASVEQLSRLTQVARISGTEFGIVETFLVKLNKALHTNAEEGKGARAALESIGLSAEELRKLDPAEAMRRVAVELTKFADDGAKGAAVWALTGKSAAQALPFLKDLATETGITARVTAEQAAAAEELQKQMRRLTNEVTEAGQALARDMVPALSNTVTAMREAYEEGGLLKALFIGLTTLSPRYGDLSKYNKEFSLLTDDLLDAQNERASRARRGQDEEVKAIDEYIKSLQERLKIVGDMRRVLSGEMDVLGNPTIKTPEKAKDRIKFGTPGTPDKRFENALRQLEQELLGVQELTSFEKTLAMVRQDSYKNLTADQRQVLTNLAAQIDLSREDAQTQKEVVAAMEASAKASDARTRAESERLGKLAEKYEDLIDPLKRYKDQLLEIDELERTGRLDPDMALKARGRVNSGMLDARYQLEALSDETRKTFDEMTEFSRQAARNIQDAFSEGLFSLMQGEFDNLGSRFKAMLDRMVSDMLAAQFLNAVSQSSPIGPTQSGGNLGDGKNILTSFGDFLLGLLPSFDVGTPYVPRDMVAKVHQGERILTAAENRSGGWGGTIIMNVYAEDVRGFRESEGQIAAALMSRLGGRARRYS